MWQSTISKQQKSDAKLLVAFMKLFLDGGFVLDTTAPDYRDRFLDLGKRAEEAVLSFLSERNITSRGAGNVLKHLRSLHRSGILNAKIERYQRLIQTAAIKDPAPGYTQDVLEVITLDGKHLLGYEKISDYEGISEDESEDSRSDIDDELKPPSGSDEDSGDESDTSIKRKDLPEIRSFNCRQVSQERKLVPKLKSQPLNQRECRCQEAKTKAFLMKTMDNTYVRLVKNLNTSYEIFTFICEQYEGAAFHGDPYFIQHYLMEIKYEEGSDLTEFLLKLENAIKAAPKATESAMTEGPKSIYLFHSMPKSWKTISASGRVRDIQAQERYTLSKGTPESNATKNERALMASGPPAPRTEYDNNDFRDGRVKAGTMLPANVALKGNSKRDHPYRNTKNRNRGRNDGNNNDKKDQRNYVGGSGRNDNRDKSRGHEQRKKRDSNSDGDADSDSDDNRRKVYRQERRETGLIAVATTTNPPLS
ncbi:Hypothetical protein PHPALM_9315 [Phytophthora palmivora]|uniref:Uncharacterized protein n=1 Tax=Phytophthora palmivora TaxID=4796 RepID=A0A2P4Y7Z2_9STRA|nr:Hypothetical protein PHPALM_9315 [Phytophthora palmivora]